MELRPLADLINTVDPAWPLVQGWLRAARYEVEVLPCDPALADKELHTLQVTTRSELGAVAHSTGGLWVDEGWIRVLGSGHPRLSRSLCSWNHLDLKGSPHRLPGVFLVGDDITGGFFGINTGGLEGEQGKLFYLAPDTHRWEPMGGMGYGQWIEWLIRGDRDAFYQDARWPSWKADIKGLQGDEDFLAWPIIFVENGMTLRGQERQKTPIERVWDHYYPARP